MITAKKRNSWGLIGSFIWHSYFNLWLILLQLKRRSVRIDGLSCPNLSHLSHTWTSGTAGHKERSPTKWWDSKDFEIFSPARHLGTKASIANLAVINGKRKDYLSFINLFSGSSWILALALCAATLARGLWSKVTSSRSFSIWSTTASRNWSFWMYGNSVCMAI